MKKNNSSFDTSISKYVIEDSSKYEFEASNDTLIIDSKCTDIVINKADVDNVQIEIEKKLGANDEEELKKANEFIECCYDGRNLNINTDLSAFKSVNSKNISSKITIPNYVKHLELNNEVGDIQVNGYYEELRVKEDTGDIKCTGEIELGDIKARVGEIELELENIQDIFKYNLVADTGDIKIHVPINSNIKIKDIEKEKVKFDKNINVNDSGAEFTIKNNIGTTEFKN